MNLLANKDSNEASSSKPPTPPVPGKPASKPPTPPKKGGVSSDAGASGGGRKGLRVSLIPSGEGAAGPNLRKRVLVLVFLLVIEALVIGGAYFYLLQISEGQGDALEDLERRRQVVAEDIEERAAAVKEMVLFDNQARAVEASLAAHPTWNSFFDIIESRTKPNVKYLNFLGDSDSGVVSLSATGKTFRDVAEQIVAFREHPKVKSVFTNAAAAKISDTGELVGVTFSMVITMDLTAWRPEQVSTQAE